MKKQLIFLTVAIFIALFTNAQTHYEYWGMTSRHIYKTDVNGENPENVYYIPHDTLGKGQKGKLFMASNNKLYGTCSQGGTNGNKGVFFEYDVENSTYNVIADYNGVNGDRPEGTVMQASNGKLYGTTSYGGANNKGTLFEYDISTSTYTVIWSFNGTDGSYPLDNLIEAENGFLYGMTSHGASGVCYYGTLFKYDIANSTLIVVQNFDSQSTGGAPEGSLLKASNGKIYGMTKNGGTHDRGVLFEYDIDNNTYSVKYNFDITNGALPTGTLIQASNGKLYGITDYGGANNKGVLFEYDIDTDTYIKKQDFGASMGSYPQGSLLEASNGKLYGVTNMGGGVSGTLFEYDIANDTLVKKFNFGGAIGGYPHNGLIEMEVDNATGFAEYDTGNSKQIITYYPNPVNDFINLKVLRDDINILSYQLLDISGRKINNSKITNNAIDMRDLRPGTYFLRVIYRDQTSSNEIKTFKIIKN